MSRKIQKIEIYLKIEGSDLAFPSADLENIFGSIVGNNFGEMLRGKRPHKPDFAVNTVRVYSLIIYTELIEYNIVRETCCIVLQASLLHFFLSF